MSSETSSGPKLELKESTTDVRTNGICENYFAIFDPDAPGTSEEAAEFTNALAFSRCYPDLVPLTGTAQSDEISATSGGKPRRTATISNDGEQGKKVARATEYLASNPKNLPEPWKDREQEWDGRLYSVLVTEGGNYHCLLVDWSGLDPEDEHVVAGQGEAMSTQGGSET